MKNVNIAQAARNAAHKSQAAHATRKVVAIPSHVGETRTIFAEMDEIIEYHNCEPIPLLSGWGVTNVMINGRSPKVLIRGEKYDFWRYVITQL